MPEAPEVSYVTNYITDHFENATLTSVQIVKGRYKTHGPPKNFIPFTKALPLRLTDIRKKGKVIFMYFDKDWCIISKLGLTGWWYTPGDEPEWRNPSPSISFNFGGKQLVYDDVLSYGTITITNQQKDVQSEMDRLAPDIEKVTIDEIVDRVQQRIKPSTTWLLEDVIVDQHRIVSGIGNYLKSEILYDAKISPLRKANTITTEEWNTILQSARKYIKRMSKYINNPDKYESSFRVYQKLKDPYGNSVKKHTTKQGRTTFWVPSMQD